MEQRNEKVRDMAVEIMHRSDELDQMSVAQLQSGNTVVSEEMVAARLATSNDVYDAALAPGHEMGGAALAYDHERCETVLAPGRELRMIIQTGDCEERMSVDQLPVCNDIRGAQDNVVVQIGQNVESKVYPTENIRRKKVSKVFPIFNSKLHMDKQNQNYDNPRGMLKPILLTPSKIRKLCIESNTFTGSSDAKNVDNLQGEICESPAKRRKYCGNGPVSQNGSQ